MAGDARCLAFSVNRMQPGIYGVTWRAAAVDTHGTEGAFILTVAP